SGSDCFGFGLSLGFGLTQLLNDDGFMCCLGQFSRQAGVPDYDLIHKSMPTSLGIDAFESHVTDCSLLATQAQQINDNKSTTPDEKIEELKELFSEHGYTITVINKTMD